MMVKCEICGKLCKGFLGLLPHISKIHNMSSKEYYDKYLKKDGEDICPVCGKLTKYLDINKGYSKHCSNLCVNRNPKVRKKVTQALLKNHGCEHALQSKDILDKQQQTCVKRFGVKNAFQSEVIKKKTKQTCIEKYGCEYLAQAEEVKEKMKQSMLENHGVEHPSYINVTNVDKWNDKKFIENNFLNKNKHVMYNKIMEFFNISEAANVTRHLNKLNIKWEKYGGTSHYEAEILEFLQLFGITNIVQNDRQLICPKELDFYLPDYNLAIEFDGIFWHSEQQGKTRYYHLEKTQACEEKGIQLIHIFETEWENKEEVIKSILKSKLYKLKKLCYARQCKIREITVKESSPFLNKHHRQGAGLSSIKLGAFYKDELVAVMTFSKPSIAKGRKDCSSTTNFEISRFASKMDYHIPGVASKLFSFFEKNYEWEKVLTFADRRYSSKAMYSTIGFELIGETAPCYWYFEKGSTVLKHRFKFRKSELERLLETFDPKLTEYQNMVNNGYDRIWDCGNLKFEYIK